ncbi:MAG: AMP-binding protein [Actinomycetota bacterium]
MNELIVLDLPGGPAFVDALRRTWDDGDAAFVLDQRLPRSAALRIVEAMAPSVIRTATSDTSVANSLPVEPGDAVVIATSGTSGEPKGVVLTHDAVRASAEATTDRIGIEQDDHWLACLPVAHVGGLSVITKALHTGTRLTVLPAFDAALAMGSGATLASLVPTAFARIDPYRFRVLLVGGAKPPEDMPSHCYTTYGMTETGSGCVYSGVPLKGVDVRIDDEGQIHLRGPMLLRTYRNVGDPKDADGWLATGDLGEWVERNGTRRLAVHGRRGELINTGGEKVWPETVERLLLAHPSVADAAVAGVADDGWGQRVVAYVATHRGTDAPTLDELRALVKGSLPAYCAPRQLVVVDAIPKTAVGKIRRNELVRDTPPA